ncbi:hypothetical protein CJ030_MR6G010465 [Morella rubra]|uniref:Uncharacterized protein n=1 Tax=Morella rubra TaxID=262757 RepID=A0A6A1VAW9_9ROSI|nr:hypothetical protein CJ030_MR6G010465 [Morella rubra]
MASPSAPSNQEAAVRKQRKGPPFKFLVPLIYAPVLPLIRITLKKNPVMRDRLFTLVLAGGFAHGLYLVSSVSVFYDQRGALKSWSASSFCNIG